MPIDIPTLFLAIIVESATLFLASGVLARYSTTNPRGLLWLTASVGLLALSFMFLALRKLIFPVVSIFLGNVGVTSMVTAYTLALDEFQKTSSPKFLLWLPSSLVGIICLFFLDSITTRIILFSVVLVIQEGYVAYRLIVRRRGVPGIGQFLILFGVILSMAVLLGRVFDTAWGIEPVAHLFDDSIAQISLFLTTFLSLNLVSLGYILMNKETEDEKFRQLALKDNLTQCWNRNHLEVAARLEMQRLQRYGIPLSLVILDIDLFKLVNDQHGHVAGDHILRGFADTARGCIRSTDVLARWGGEEFSLLLPSSGYTAAASTAERIRKEFSEATFGGIKATVSAGYATCQTTDTWEELFQRADRALYRAKSLGRNRVEPEIPVLPAASQTELLFKVVWQQDYCVGHALIDEQHKHLFYLANQLQTSLHQGVTHKQTEEYIGTFILNLRKHFATEDNILLRHDHPDVHEHSVLHQKLIAHAEDLLEKFRHHKVEAEILVNFIVLEVTVQHMLIADRAVSHFMDSALSSSNDMQ